MHKKTRNILMIIYILVLIAVVSGATFAYFSVLQVSNVAPTAKAQTATTEWLLFNTGEEINITATEENFGSGMGSLTGTTFANVLLRTSNSAVPVSHNYDLFLEITANEFIYSTPTRNAELLLTVSDPDGNELTHIDGLDYVTVGDIAGFDITEKTGRFYIAEGYEITTDTVVEQTWNIEITFVNLDSDQQANTGKNFASILQVERSSI